MSGQILQQEPQLLIYPLDKRRAIRLVAKYHYSDVMPRLTTHYLGGFVDEQLYAVITLGWGVRPLHTIKKLFPTLTPKDYFEIGKMCITPNSPFNGSQFLGEVIKWVRSNAPNLKLIFTWADGILGKSGTVYQASNFLYGGFIWTDCYFRKARNISSA